MENYSPEDHRHDLRPVFYPLDFTWQFRRIDELVSFMEIELILKNQLMLILFCFRYNMLRMSDANLHLNMSYKYETQKIVKM